MKERISYQQLPAGLIDAMREVERYLGQTAIEQKILVLMRFYVSQLNTCAYCIDMHFKEALALGEEHIRLHSITSWRDTDYYSEREQALLAWAESVTKLNKSTEQQDEAFNALKLYFSLQQIADITLAISQINAWNRLMKSFLFIPGRYQAAANEV